MGVVFLTLLAAGFLGVLALCRMDQVAWKFVRLITILALAELSLAVAGYIGFAGGKISSLAVTAAVLSFLAGGCAFLAMGFAPVSSRYAAAVRLLAGTGSLLALSAAWAWGSDQQIWLPALAPAAVGTALTSAASAFLMGAVSLAMLLGHAYLTHTEMTIQPLRRLAGLFAAGMIARVLLALAVGACCVYGARTGRISPDLLRDHQLVLGLRYVVGLVIPSIFCFMVWRTVQLRATQSATGILYFGLVLIYLGELAAIQLTRELRIPF